MSRKTSSPLPFLREAQGTGDSIEVLHGVKDNLCEMRANAYNRCRARADAETIAGDKNQTSEGQIRGVEAVADLSFACGSGFLHGARWDVARHADDLV